MVWDGFLFVLFFRSVCSHVHCRGPCTSSVPKFVRIIVHVRLRILVVEIFFFFFFFCLVNMRDGYHVIICRTFLPTMMCSVLVMTSHIRFMMVDIMVERHVARAVLYYAFHFDIFSNYARCAPFSPFFLCPFM